MDSRQRHVRHGPGTSAHVSALHRIAYLLPSSCFHQVGLGDYLDSIVLATVECGAKIDLGKASSSQQATPEIAVQGITVSVDTLSFFFDNDVFVVGVVAIVFRTSRRSRCGSLDVRPPMSGLGPTTLGSTNALRSSWPLLAKAGKGWSTRMCKGARVFLLASASMVRMARLVAGGGEGLDSSLVVLVVGGFQGGQTIDVHGAVGTAAFSGRRHAASL